MRVSGAGRPTAVVALAVPNAVVLAAGPIRARRDSGGALAERGRLERERAAAGRCAVDDERARNGDLGAGRRLGGGLLVRARIPLEPS